MFNEHFEEHYQKSMEETIDAHVPEFLRQAATQWIVQHFPQDTQKRNMKAYMMAIKTKLLDI
ncbi:hypothetical protein GCM10011332_14790 [Terasakiella brassicae]|uniref:Uncharacterized protein n=1 Tax=Terasakiella brassicae TaxID=1634917 RepID=A0A917BYY1_9PROT|nr:hypothetical protein GCM10011332_14790 [Terasakiella brassicae]